VLHCFAGTDRLARRSRPISTKWLAKARPPMAIPAAARLHEGQVAFQGTVHQVFAEDHWDVLDELHIPVPRVARLARELGVEALRMDELIGKLA
jgi:hypothetical protein